MPTKDPILTFVVKPELLKRITDFRFDNRIDTKSEAIRKLLEAGIEALTGEKVIYPDEETQEEK